MSSKLHNKLDTSLISVLEKSIKLIDLIKLILKENNKIGSNILGKSNLIKIQINL